MSIVKDAQEIAGVVRSKVVKKEEKKVNADDGLIKISDYGLLHLERAKKIEEENGGVLPEFWYSGVNISDHSNDTISDEFLHGSGKKKESSRRKNKNKEDFINIHDNLDDEEDSKEDDELEDTIDEETEQYEEREVQINIAERINSIEDEESQYD